MGSSNKFPWNYYWLWHGNFQRSHNVQTIENVCLWKRRWYLFIFAKLRINQTFIWTRNKAKNQINITPSSNFSTEHFTYGSEIIGPSIIEWYSIRSKTKCYGPLECTFKKRCSWIIFQPKSPINAIRINNFRLVKQFLKLKWKLKLKLKRPWITKRNVIRITYFLIKFVPLIELLKFTTTYK